MLLKNCKRCGVSPTVNKRAKLYGQSHTRVSCPKCGFTIWTRNGGNKDPETVWNDCNKRVVVYEPWSTFRIATGANKVPKGYCNDECTFIKSGAKAFDDFNYDE